MSARVVRVEIDLGLDQEATITVRRAVAMVRAPEPDAADLPADFRHALLVWLGASV